MKVVTFYMSNGGIHKFNDTKDHTPPIQYATKLSSLLTERNITIIDINDHLVVIRPSKVDLITVRDLRNEQDKTEEPAQKNNEEEIITDEDSEVIKD